jgi:hypothetical protein
MARPRGKKSEPYRQNHRTESQETIKSREVAPHESAESDHYSNHRAVNEDTESVEEVLDEESIPDVFKGGKKARTESVEEVLDEESIPDVFKGGKKARSSHIWQSENGEEYTSSGITRWKCLRCKFPRFNNCDKLL